MSCVRDFLVLFSMFVRWKVTTNEHVSFTDHASKIRLPNFSKLTINWKKALTSRFSGMTSSSVFLTWRVSLPKFSYWSKFHVNIIAASGVMTIFNYKGLTRNPETGNTSAWVFPNIWRLGQVMNTKFNTNTNVSNEMLLNAAKCQV